MGDVPRAAAAVLVFAGAAFYQRRRNRHRREHVAQLQRALSLPEALPAEVAASEQTGLRDGRLSNPWLTALPQLSTALGRWQLLVVAGIIVGAACYRRDVALASALLLLPTLQLLPFRSSTTQSERASWTVGRRHRQEEARERAQQAATHLQLLAGTWIKDKVASDSMEPAVQLMQLGRLVRSAVRLVKGIRIRIVDDSFEMAVFSAIPWFKVIETYPLSGASVRCKRRDLRRGHHTGHARVTNEGHVALAIAWVGHLGGTGTELYRLVDSDTLHVTSTITVDGETCRYVNVHKRQAQ